MMNKRFEELYRRNEELDERYEANKGNEQECEKIREDYHALCDEINSEGEFFGWAYKLYESMKDRGNTYIDVDELNDDRKVAGLINAFRENGIQFFTFSSGWSSSVETAWELTKNGCTLCGMMEINSKHKGFMDDKYEKAHGYLFKVF